MGAPEAEMAAPYHPHVQTPSVGVPPMVDPPVGPPQGYYTPQPFPGIAVKPPLVPPQPGMVILAYQFDEVKTGCCQCEGVNALGWLVVILALIFFWPLCFIVCLIPEFFDKYQRPVYGYPTAAPGMPAGGPPPKY